MSFESTTDLHHHLTEAVIDPTCWPTIMEELCRFYDATGAIMLQSDVRTPDLPRTSSVKEAMYIYFRDGWHCKDERARAVNLQIRGFPVVFDRDIIANEEIKKSAYYNDLLYKYDIPWFASVGFDVGDRLWGMSFFRNHRRGTFDEEDRRRLSTLTPALNRAARLSAALGHASVMGTLNGLCRVGKAAMALRRDGVVVGVNAAMDSKFEDNFYVKNRRLQIADKAARSEYNSILADLLSNILSVSPNRDVIVRERRRGPLVLNFVEIDGPASSVFGGAKMLVVATDIGSSVVPPVEKIRRVFLLSKAESRVAFAFASGQSLEQISSSEKIAVVTVRNHLKSIFSKTGTHRQSELMRLLLRI